MVYLHLRFNSANGKYMLDRQWPAAPDTVTLVNSALPCLRVSVWRVERCIFQLGSPLSVCHSPCLKTHFIIPSPRRNNTFRPPPVFSVTIRGTPLLSAPRHYCLIAPLPLPFRPARQCVLPLFSAVLGFCCFLSVLSGRSLVQVLPAGKAQVSSPKTSVLSTMPLGIREVNLPLSGGKFMWIVLNGCISPVSS